MATLLAHLRVRAGSEDRFEELARRLYEASHRSEAGLRRYEYLRSAEPRSYYCLLSFDDEASFLGHQASDHHEAASAELVDMLEASRFEWVDPVDGAAPLVRTEATGPAHDAGELERAYHRAMGVAVAEWWEERRTAADG